MSSPCISQTQGARGPVTLGFEHRVSRCSDEPTRAADELMALFFSRPPPVARPELVTFGGPEDHLSVTDYGRLARLKIELRALLQENLDVTQVCRLCHPERLTM